MERIFYYSNFDKDVVIEDYLRSIGYSKGCLSFLKRNKGVFVNGVHVNNNSIISPNDELKIIFYEQGNKKIKPFQFDIEVLYEDEDIIVVNKPPHMPVHPSSKNQTTTLANAMAYYLPNVPFRCITRLDTDTTGLVLLAKNMLAAHVLHSEMQQRKIEKEYIAFVSNFFQRSEGTIDLPIARKDEGNILRVVSKNGQEAITHYQVINQYDSFSIVQLKLQTGRTHQIRVHMAHIGHPVIGDKLYNKSNQLLDRQALHAYKLIFTHPITKQVIKLEAELPKDMHDLVFLQSHTNK